MIGELTAEQWLFIGSRRSATLVTIGPDGAPRPVPICFVVMPPVLYTPLDDKPKQGRDPRSLARVRDITARPQVVLLFDRWDEDWARLGWVRVHGSASLLEPPTAPAHPDAAKEHEHAVRLLREKYPQYRDHLLERRPLISVVLTHAISWGAVTETRVTG